MALLNFAKKEGQEKNEGKQTANCIDTHYFSTADSSRCGVYDVHDGANRG